MADFTIRTYGDPVLRTPGEPVREFGPALRSLGDAMLAAMRKAKGIGLAAPQVGLSLQLFVADVRDEEFTPLLDGRPVATDALMPMLFANAEVTVPPVTSAGRPLVGAADSVPAPAPKFQATVLGVATALTVRTATALVVSGLIPLATTTSKLPASASWVLVTVSVAVVAPAIVEPLPVTPLARFAEPLRHW